MPLHPRRVRLPPLRPPRQGVSQVSVAAQPAVLHAQVRWGGVAEDVEREEGDVRGGLPGAEPVRVAAVHAPRRRAQRPDHRHAGVGKGRPLHHHQLRGVQRDDRLLPDALPGGPCQREGRARPQAGRHRPGTQLARRRRARLRLLALVAALRPDAAVGLHPGGQHGGEGHGQDGGLHQGAQHLGQMGRRQPRPDQHQSLLPGNLALSLQGPRLGRHGEGDVHGADAAGERQHGGGVPRRGDPAAGGAEERPGRHGEAGVPAGLHLPVAAEEGRAPDQVRRRDLRRGLHPLVRRRTPGHLERPLLRRAHRTAVMAVITASDIIELGYSGNNQKEIYRYRLILYRSMERFFSKKKEQKVIVTKVTKQMPYSFSEMGVKDAVIGCQRRIRKNCSQVVRIKINRLFWQISGLTKYFVLVAIFTVGIPLEIYGILFQHFS